MTDPNWSAPSPNQQRPPMPPPSGQPYEGRPAPVAPAQSAPIPPQQVRPPQPQSQPAMPPQYQEPPSAPRPQQAPPAQGAPQRPVQTPAPQQAQQQMPQPPQSAAPSAPAPVAAPQSGNAVNAAPQLPAESISGAVVVSPDKVEKPDWYQKIESQIMLWADLNVSDIQMVSDNYVWIVDDDNHQPTSLWLTREDILLLADYWVPGNKEMGILNGAKILVEGESGILETVQNLGRSFSMDNTNNLPWRARIIFRRQENGLGVTMRLIPPKVPTLAKYPQPPQILKLLSENNGLFIVSGPTGSGKTTLLAALLNEYNETNHRHIYTIEDPIEFVHQPKKCLITQREVGRDVDDWAGGIMAAVRSKAQVIMIGELRELDAIIAALDAANKGHLVFATSHASSAAQCIEGIVSQFPPGQQNLVQNRIAEVFKCVMVQRLVPSTDGKLIPVREIMVDHTTTTPNIRSGEFTKLTGALKEEDDMISFEQSLFYLYEQGKITEETALKYANIKNDLVFKIDRLKKRRAEMAGKA